MTEVQFDKIVKERIEKIKTTLIEKGKEYRRNNSVFHNFEVGAKMANQSREKVLYGFLLKHLISFQDMINDIEANNMPIIETLEEKIGDIINYCILFEASVKDKIETENNNLEFTTDFRELLKNNINKFEVCEKTGFYTFTKEKLEEITNPLKNTQDLIDTTNITHT